MRPRARLSSPPCTTNATRPSSPFHVWPWTCFSALRLTGELIEVTGGLLAGLKVGPKQVERHAHALGDSVSCNAAIKSIATRNTDRAPSSFAARVLREDEICAATRIGGDSGELAHPDGPPAIPTLEHDGQVQEPRPGRHAGTPDEADVGRCIGCVVVVSRVVDCRGHHQDVTKRNDKA